MALKAKKTLNTINFKRIKKIIKSKSFIGSIIFAMSLWIYTSLNSPYVPIVEIPLQIKLPQNKAIETPLPPTISVKVKGSGWDIFNLIFFNSSAKCIINLSDHVAAEGKYQVSRNEILKGLQSLANVEALDVMPESLVVEIGLVGQYYVPITPRLIIQTRKGFTVAGAYKIEPRKVMISGNDKFVQHIKEWFTEPVYISDVYKSLNLTVSLSDSLKNMITLSQNHINIFIDIQQKTELTINDVKINIRGGGTLPKYHVLAPLKLNVTLQGGADYVSKISEDMIHAYVEYSDVVNDSTGYIVPKVYVADSNVKVLSITPQFIYHKKIINSVRELSDIKF